MDALLVGQVATFRRVRTSLAISHTAENRLRLLGNAVVACVSSATSSFTICGNRRCVSRKKRCGCSKKLQSKIKNNIGNRENTKLRQLRQMTKRNNNFSFHASIYVNCVSVFLLVSSHLKLVTKCFFEESVSLFLLGANALLTSETNILTFFLHLG